MSTIVFKKVQNSEDIESSMDELNGIISSYGSFITEKSKLEAIRKIRRLRAAISMELK
ncbi:MAG: hypothetical protein JXR86_16190 [Spirochaetales bacterium]|nr:hypothetical protein [Spirochaetales bacterium]